MSGGEVIRRWLIVLALLAVTGAACTRMVVLTPPVDGGIDVSHLPDAGVLPDAFTHD
jgi:hypothetical protein